MAIRLTDQGEEFDQIKMRQLIRELEFEIDKLKQPAKRGYTVTSGTESRTLNASTATLAELRNFVGTLIDDLKAVGRLGR